MSSVLDRLRKPYYLFRPTQVLVRARYRIGGRVVARDRSTIATSRLPWGASITYWEQEHIGSSIARTGVFELPVTELIFRLLEPEDTALDIGANIGYMTSAMAAAVGRKGRVVSFEPHPDVFALLATNVDRWRSETGCAIEVHEIALSSREGVAALNVPTEFGHNSGVSSLEAPTASSTTVNVRTARLDDIVGPIQKVGLLKIDVEGHEAAVFAGATQLLSTRLVRDIVFEDLGSMPTPLSSELELRGYTVLGIQEGWLGVGLSAPDDADLHWMAPTYLATLDPERAVERLRRRGWVCLRRPGAHRSRRENGS